jgi:hypothetical protein
VPVSARMVASHGGTVSGMGTSKLDQIDARAPEGCRAGGAMGRCAESVVTGYGWTDGDHGNTIIAGDPSEGSMIWFLVVALGAGACCASYIVGDYFGFRRGKQNSHLLWQERTGRVWTEPGQITIAESLVKLHAENGDQSNLDRHRLTGTDGFY